MRLLLAAALFAASTLAATPAFAQLTFADAMEEALAQLPASGGGVLLDIYATWCGPCQRLDEEVFPTTLAGEVAAGLVAIKVDAEAGEGLAIVERYHVVGYPTVLVLDAEGNEVDRIFGFLPAEEFASTLRSSRRQRHDHRAAGRCGPAGRPGARVGSPSAWRCAGRSTTRARTSTA